MFDKGWKRLTDENIESLSATIISDISKYRELHELRFYVGCDSQIHGKEIVYTKAIALRKVGHGALGYYSRQREEVGRFKNHRERLFEETYRIVEVAKWLDDIILEHGYIVEQVHADLNPSSDFLSNCVVSQCLGYIKAMGYTGVIKPDSWVSSKIADIKTK